VRLAFGAVALIGMAIVGCTQTAPSPGTGEKGAKGSIVAANGCADGAARLAITNVCANQLAPFMTADAGPALGAPRPDCTWTGQEIKSPDDNEAFVVMAARCGAATSALEMSAGARSASFLVTESAVFGKDRVGQEMVRVFLVGDQDGKKMIQDLARQTTASKREAAACTLRPVGEGDGMPKDGFVVDVTEAYKRANKLGQPTDGPGGGYAVCGDWGYQSEANAYWLIRGGYAFFINNGQDLPDFDFSTLTVMKRAPGGAWASVK
jgi:hypothetical protein